MNVLALCAGVGGLELGIHIAQPGARGVAYVEREAYAAAVLVARMEAGELAPAPVWSDLAAFDARPWRGVVHCVASGDPCQPNSVAGKRLGDADDRFLIDQVVRIVDECRPDRVFRENVAGNADGQLAASHLAARDCALFLWAIDPLLDVAIDALKGWGFRYVSVGFTWAKRTRRDTGWHMGTGYGTRANSEICLLGMTGSLGLPRNRDVRRLVVEPVREHSRKPDRIHTDVERLYDGPYCELFARSRRPGWESWGNDVDHFAGVGKMVEEPRLGR